MGRTLSSPRLAQFTERVLIVVADGSIRVVVAMTTYRRPEGLARAVPALLAQVEAASSFDATLLVVDNDPDRSAEAWLSAHRHPLLRWAQEPRPGISAARNRCLDEARGADAIVFIDDDEVPDEGWLDAMVGSWRRWGCAAVTGPVDFVVDSGADDWLRASGVFTKAHRVTGSVNPGASSANLLLDLHALARHGIRFDEAFGLSGGSDTMLAHTLRHRGEEIRWCQEAGVSEHVPLSRTNRGWVFRRTVRTSNTWGRVRVALAPPGPRRFVTRGEVVGRGSVRLLRGLAVRAVARLRASPGADARGAVDMASGIGLMMAGSGLVRYEYQRTPSTGPAQPSRTG